MKVIDEFHLVTSIPLDADVGAKSITIIKSTQFNAFRHFINLFKAFKIIKKIDPAAIFSTGGPICIPFSIIAKLLGIRFVYLDTLSRVIEPSNSAKFLYKFKLADEIFCQWECLTKKYPKIQYYGKTFDICNDRNESL